MFHYDKTLFGSPLGIKGNYPLKKKKNATRRKEKERSREKRDKEIERQR